MIRPILVALVFTAVAHADVVPEKLLSPTTQIYYRWDGVAAHRDAYRKSARGQMLAGDTGKFIADVYERLLRKFAFDSFGAPLLKGQNVDELAAKHSNFRLAAKLPELLAETGIVAGFELRSPTITLQQVGAIFGLSKRDKPQSLKDIDLQLTLIIPNAAGRKEVPALFQLFDGPTIKWTEVRHLDRVAQELLIDEFRIAWWAEGKHFVITVGTVPTKTAITRMAGAGDGVTAHPLYQQLDRKQKFEVVSRAFGDGASLWRVIRVLLAGSGNARFYPLLELSGLTGIQTVRLWEGFDGDESRSITEVDVVGPREGITKLYKAGKFDLKDLPPLPADVHRWSAGVVDITAAYELGLGYFLFPGILFGDGSTTKSTLLEQRQEIADQFDGVLGVKVADLLATLGDLGVTYQSPGDGLLAAGQVFAIRIKDEAAFKRHLGQLVQGIEKLGRDGLKVTRRTYEGVETREFTLKESGFVLPTVAICDGWLVAAAYPQPVKGFILRSKGKLPAWKPDERTARALAAIPSGPAAVQYSDPRQTVKLLLGGAQPLLGYLSTKKEFRDIIDPGLLPNPEEACKPLFPNLLWTHNDGKTIRWETRESLALPLEIIGIETLIAFYAATAIR